MKTFLIWLLYLNHLIAFTNEHEDLPRLVVIFIALINHLISFTNKHAWSLIWLLYLLLWYIFYLLLHNNSSSEAGDQIDFRFTDLYVIEFNIVPIAWKANLKKLRPWDFRTRKWYTIYCNQLKKKKRKILVETLAVRVKCSHARNLGMECFCHHSLPWIKISTKLIVSLSTQFQIVNATWNLIWCQNCLSTSTFSTDFLPWLVYRQTYWLKYGKKHFSFSNDLLIK